MPSAGDLSNTIRSQIAEFHENLKESNWHLNLLDVDPSNSFHINVIMTMMVSKNKVCMSSIGPNVAPLQWAKLYIFLSGNSWVYFLRVETENVDLSFMVSVGSCSVGSVLEGIQAVALLLKSDFKWIRKDKMKKKKKTKIQNVRQRSPQKKKKKLKPLELCKNNRKFILN